MAAGKMYRAKRTYKFKKRRKKRNWIVNTVNKNNPLPKQFKTKLRYETQVLIDPGLSAVGVHIIRANGMFDPDWTGSGHQPRYFDEFMNSYDHFTVTSAKCTAMMVNPNNEGYVLAIQLAESPVSPLTINNMIEGRNSTWTLVGHQYSSTAVKSTTKSINVSNYLGIKDLLSSSNARGDAAADPVEGCYFVVALASFNNLVNAPAAPVRILIDYTVTFTEPKLVTQS